MIIFNYNFKVFNFIHERPGVDKKKEGKEVCVIGDLGIEIPL